MKRLVLIALLQGILVLSLVAPIYGKLGMGVSHRDLSDVRVYAGSTLKVETARVYNTGDEPFKATWSWIQEPKTVKVKVKVNETEKEEEREVFIPVQVLPETQVLQPEESVLVYLLLKPTSEHLGKWRGRLEISGQPMTVVEGNPVVPGGTVEANITVEKPPTPQKTGWDLETLDLVIVGLFFSLIIGGVICGVYVLKGRRLR